MHRPRPIFCPCPFTATHPSGPHSLQAYRDQLCANLDTANATLAADVAAGGATAQTAYLAMFVGNPDGGPYACPQGVRLAQLFVDFATAGNATITSVTE